MIRSPGLKELTVTKNRLDKKDSWSTRVCKACFQFDPNFVSTLPKFNVDIAPWKNDACKTILILSFCNFQVYNFSGVNSLLNFRWVYDFHFTSPASKRRTCANNSRITSEALPRRSSIVSAPKRSSSKWPGLEIWWVFVRYEKSICCYLNLEHHLFWNAELKPTKTQIFIDFPWDLVPTSLDFCKSPTWSSS